MEIERTLNLLELLKKKSFFLFGPRSTGKSTLIKQQLGGSALLIDLLDSDLYLRLSSRPHELEHIIKGSDHSSLIVVDEVQKVPQLLDEVHRLIEKKQITFLLTGSSVRKLKGNQSNLLAGRAWLTNLFPLTWKELGAHFDIEKYLLYGGLPNVYLSSEPKEELRAYVKTYLLEEIQAEALVRKLPSFSRFLEVASLDSGNLLNFTAIGSDAEVAPSTIREFYYILEDTLMGMMLPAWTKSKKRKAIQTAKFYFFDIGVINFLTHATALDRNSDLYGRAFEHFIGMELRAYLNYTRTFDELSFWRSVNGQEVDFLIGDHTAIEVKSTRKVTDRHLRGLKALAEEKIVKNLIIVSHDPLQMSKDGILHVHWENFLETLWAGKIEKSGLFKPV